MLYRLKEQPLCRTLSQLLDVPLPKFKLSNKELSSLDGEKLRRRCRSSNGPLFSSKRLVSFCSDNKRFGVERAVAVLHWDTGVLATENALKI